MRFEIAIYQAVLTAMPTMRRNKVAMIAVCFNASIGDATWIGELINGQPFEGISLDYKAGKGSIIPAGRIERERAVHRFDPDLRQDAILNRRDKLIREAPTLIRQAQDLDRKWLLASTTTLLALFRGAVAQPLNIKISRALLAYLGTIDPEWPARLVNAIPKTPVESNT
jgi:hypothetical protein